MSSFTVNPPIADDLDYYRFDDSVVDKVLSGHSLLCVGLRRSGKTSFLFRIARAAKRSGRETIFVDLPSLAVERDIRTATSQIGAEIISKPNAIVLLDEAEAFPPDDHQALSQLIDTAKKNTVVLSCAPVFVLELRAYSDSLQVFAERCYRHIVGPLASDEAAQLLGQSKRCSFPLVGEPHLSHILRSGERLPIVLQALGESLVRNVDVSISLAGLGSRVLCGLGDRARKTLIDIAWGRQRSLTGLEQGLLVSVGALKIETKGSQGKTLPTIASQVVADFIKQAFPPVGKSVARARTSLENRPWTRYAQILHLSDLHFGPKCIADAKSVDSQLKRLTDALDSHGIKPEFIAVTGDLSWSGNRKELKVAEKFLAGLSDWLGARHGWSADDSKARNRFLVIPGNHDAAWALSAGLKPDNSDDFVLFSSAPYANFVNRFHKGLVFWDMESPFLLRHFPDLSMCFIALSTSHLITATEKDGQFGPGVLQSIPDLMQSDEVRNSRFRIGLVHHNLRPFGDGPDCIRDMERAGLEFSKCHPSIDLILHGHVHQGDVDNFYPRRNRAPIPYSSVGSFGVQAEHRPGDSKHGQVPNEFAVINFETNGNARRFFTQYFHHSLTPVAEWEWQPSKQMEPRNLG
jgi:DNA repair exonuclease SbcCD nuclease subunit